MRKKIIEISNSLGVKLAEDDFNVIYDSIRTISKYEDITEEQLYNMVFCYLRDNSLLD